MFCKFLLGNVSPRKAEEQLGPLLRFVIVFTFVGVVIAAFHIMQFRLDKRLMAKLYHVFSVLIGIAVTSFVWKLYFCFRQRARMNNTP